MKSSPARISLIALFALTSGCATQRFGREQHVTQAERTALTCDQIDLEIAKVNGFLQGVADQYSHNHVRRAMGYAGDFGIGNRNEYSDAIKSGNDRWNDLMILRGSKVCLGQPEPLPALTYTTW